MEGFEKNVSGIQFSVDEGCGSSFKEPGPVLPRIERPRKPLDDAAFTLGSASATRNVGVWRWEIGVERGGTTKAGRSQPGARGRGAEECSVLQADPSG